MQQRYGPFLGRVPEEHVVYIGDVYIDPYEPRGVAGKKWRSSENWASAIPLVILFFLFVLWWFSFTVKVVSIGGKIAAIHETDIPLLLNNTRLGIALLAAEAMSPVALVPQNFTVTNITEVQLVNTAQNTTANNATEAQLVSLVPQNLTVNNVTEAQLVSNRSQSPAVKNVTEAQLLSKRIQNITANNVTKIQLASKQTRNLRPNRFTAAQLVSKQTKNFTAIKVTVAQLVSSKQRISQPIMSLELGRRVQLP